MFHRDHKVIQLYPHQLYHQHDKVLTKMHIELLGQRQNLAYVHPNKLYSSNLPLGPFVQEEYHFSLQKDVRKFYNIYFDDTHMLLVGQKHQLLKEQHSQPAQDKRLLHHLGHVSSYKV
ncbi:MAG TPA: hypothetical protein [Caudoviricetes sp.]|nr:MAG TPA: hypothetical protein [Caudoviricetes sp.]